jgi:hypothetical protein
MVLNRSAVVDAGLFREDFPGVEDWDLWLRMAQEHGRFVGTTEFVIRYRIHPASMSADPSPLQRSARLMVESLFGPDDDRPNEWAPAKRRAWGGYYRYCALTSIIRAEDWAASAAPLARALVVDPSLADDTDLFYELALGAQPVGWRGTRERLDLRANMHAINGVLQRVFATQTDVRLATLHDRVHQATHIALAQVASLAGEHRLSRSFQRSAARHDRRALLRLEWWRNYARTYVPERFLVARRARSRTSGLL